MQPLSGASTPQKLISKQKENNNNISTPENTFKFRLEDASPETEKVISYLRDLKQQNNNNITNIKNNNKNNNNFIISHPRRSAKPQSLPFSVKDTSLPLSSTKGPLGLINITVCTCTCTSSSSSSPSKKNIIKHSTKCSSSSFSSSLSLSSSSQHQKENINPNLNNRIHKIPSSSSSNKRTPPPVIKKEQKKEEKMRKEGPNPLWDVQFQKVKVRQVKCEQVKMYPNNIPYALVYIFS